jgi:phosphatidate cytidylyltransferase
VKDFGKRLLLSLFVIPAIGCLLVFSSNSWFQYCVSLLVSLFASIAVWEYAQFVKEKGGKPLLFFLLPIAFLEVFSFFLAGIFPSLGSLPLFLFLAALIGLFALHFKNKEGAIIDLAVSSFGLIYIAVPIGMLLGVLYFPSGVDGRWWVLYLLFVTKTTDIGAYFAGNLWGKRRLAPTISPGKTVEGTLFGVIAALVVSLGFFFFGDLISGGRFSVSFEESLILGMILGLLGPLGDLSESLLKRDANKKDSNALPGLGGTLDMVDSLLFNAPVMYLYLYFIKV